MDGVEHAVRLGQVPVEGDCLQRRVDIGPDGWCNEYPGIHGAALGEDVDVVVFPLDEGQVRNGLEMPGGVIKGLGESFLDGYDSLAG